MLVSAGNVEKMESLEKAELEGKFGEIHCRMSAVSHIADLGDLLAGELSPATSAYFARERDRLWALQVAMNVLAKESMQMLDDLQDDLK